MPRQSDHLKQQVPKLGNGLLFHVLKSFWAFPILSIIASILLTVLMLTLDGSGASKAINAWGWPFDMSGETARETAAAMTAIIVALVTLFFSITLIVLTMASSALGVRLIDRWIGNRTIRATLSILLALLSMSIIILAATDPTGPVDRIPRLSLVTLIGLLLLTLGWLSYAFHHLSRRIHVDTSIVSIGDDLKADLEAHSYNDYVTAVDPDTPYKELRADQSGYIDSLEIADLINLSEQTDYRLKMKVATGHFVLENDVIAHLWYKEDDSLTSDIKSAIPIRSFRTEGQGARFRANLLAEIAARALSPAVNDLYTAITCIDYLMAAFSPAFETVPSEGWIPNEAKTPVLKLEKRYLIVVIDTPLRVLRQAAAPYPTVAIHLAEALHRLKARCRHDSDRDYMATQIRQVVNTALTHADLQEDVDALKSFLNDPSETDG